MVVRPSARRRTFGRLCFALVVAGVMVLACGGKALESSEGSGKPDAAPDVSVADSSAPDSGACCTPGGQSCCLDYGGWTPPERACGSADCDGMPVPSDPDWKIEPDSHGCPHWANPHDYFHGGTRSDAATYCGASQPAGDQVDAAACTAEMRASVRTTGSCDGPNPGNFPYTGILDFACADTSVDAPDRSAKLAAFCASHPFASARGPLLEGNGFVCLCFVS
jgi:hypothetical protein